MGMHSSMRGKYFIIYLKSFKLKNRYYDFN
jgi:hypothetical protein